MAPISLQLVLSIQKDISQIVQRATATRTKKEDDVVKRFGDNKQSTEKDAEDAKRRAKNAASSCASEANAVPTMVFNWTTTTELRGRNLRSVVQKALQDPTVSKDEFKAVQAALESELERYQPATCPRKPILKRIVECFRAFDSNYGGGGGSGSGVISAFGGASGSSGGDLGGSFGGGSSPSPDKLASECIRLINQIGGINFRFTATTELRGQNIAALAASILSSAWTGGSKPAPSKVAYLKQAIRSEGQNFDPATSALAGALMSLAECLQQYEDSL
jgi:hypothetical protein